MAGTAVCPGVEEWTLCIPVLYWYLSSLCQVPNQKKGKERAGVTAIFFVLFLFVAMRGNGRGDSLPTI